jgi:ketosteroid isomerase-like protein
MTKENVELVHRVQDAWNRRDLDALVALSDPDAEYVNSPTAVEPGTRRGVDELTAVMQAQWELLLDGRGEIDRTYDRGDEIIVLGRLSRRMPGSQDRLEDRILSSVRFRNGKLTRMEILGFGSGEVRDALKAAGLDE